MRTTLQLPEAALHHQNSIVPFQLLPTALKPKFQVREGERKSNFICPSIRASALQEAQKATVAPIVIQTSGENKEMKEYTEHAPTTNG